MSGRFDGENFVLGHPERIMMVSYCSGFVHNMSLCWTLDHGLPSSFNNSPNKRLELTRSCGDSGESGESGETDGEKN